MRNTVLRWKEMNWRSVTISVVSETRIQESGWYLLRKKATTPLIACRESSLSRDCGLCWLGFVDCWIFRRKSKFCCNWTPERERKEREGKRKRKSDRTVGIEWGRWDLRVEGCGHGPLIGDRWHWQHSSKGKQTGIGFDSVSNSGSVWVFHYYFLGQAVMCLVSWLVGG